VAFHEWLVSVIVNICKRNKIFIQNRFISPTYSLKQGLLEKLELAQLTYEEDNGICWKKQRSCRVNQTPHTGNTRNPPTCLIDHRIGQPNMDVSQISTLVITAEVKRNYSSVQCRLNGKIVFFVLVPYGEFVSSVMTSILIILLCRASYV
jgi:hypothetical protein